MHALDGVDVLGLDMPCTFWSTARRWDGGSPPLHGYSATFLFCGESGWGRQNLRPHDVDEANEGIYVFLYVDLSVGAY